VSIVGASGAAIRFASERDARCICGTASSFFAGKSDGRLFAPAGEVVLKSLSDAHTVDIVLNVTE
jgi:hypothetical protein